MGDHTHILLEQIYTSILEKTNLEDKQELFIDKRKQGAIKIAKQAEAKGSYSSLTAVHFKAKDKPYSFCLKNFLDPESINNKADELLEKLKNWREMSQMEFQKVMGELEVYGEVALQLRTPKNY